MSGMIHSPGVTPSHIPRLWPSSLGCALASISAWSRGDSKNCPDLCPRGICSASTPQGIASPINYTAGE